jgi:hypothetical protein
MRKALDLEQSKTWIEVIKNIVQILAIIIAGFWTYILFVQQDAPILEPRASTNGNLSIQPIQNSDNCELIYNVGLRNIGTTSFDVTKVTVKGWNFQRQAPGEFAQFLDVQLIQKQANLFFNKAYTDENNDPDVTKPFYIEHYPPDHQYNNTFSWIVKNDSETWVLIHVQFFAKTNGKDYSWQTYHWIQTNCQS